MTSLEATEDVRHWLGLGSMIRAEAKGLYVFCPHCGTPTRDDDAWCPACGTILPGARGYEVEPAPSRGLAGLVGEPGIRMLAYGAAGLIAMLVLGEMLRVVVALILPAILIMLLIYWARERRRRFYNR